MNVGCNWCFPANGWVCGVDTRAICPNLPPVLYITRPVGRMSSDDASSSSPYRSPTTSFTDVFKTLGVVRPKSLSPVPWQDSHSDFLSAATDGRRSARSVFGFDSMHRGSVVSSASDAPSGPDFETAVKALGQRQSLANAIDEAELVARSIHRFTSDQSLTLWDSGSYLLFHESSVEARRSGSRLIEAVASRQDLSPAARRSIFESISLPSDPDVIPSRVRSLIALSDHGRKLDFSTSSVLPMISSCVVPLYDLISSARLKARKAKVAKVNGLGYDDVDLDDLLQFAVDLITLQRKPPNNEEVQEFLSQIFTICKKTSVAADIKNSLAVFDSIILYADVPDGSFIPMLEVLCSIHASVKSLSGPTSRAVRNLAKSRRQTEMVDALFSFLLESSEEYCRNLNVLRGTIYVLADLIRAHGQDGIPELDFEQLMGALHVIIKKDDGRLEADILELSLNVLDGEYAQVALERSWSSFVDLLVLCSRKAIDEPEDGVVSPSGFQTFKSATLDDTKSSIQTNIIQSASLIEMLWGRLDQRQKLDAGRFLMIVSEHIEPSQADLILNAMRSEKLCFPENPDFVKHSQKLINSFIRSRTKPSGVRILALDTLKEAFQGTQSLRLFIDHGLLDLLLQDFSDENDVLLLESIVSLIVDISTSATDGDKFQMLVNTISSPMKHDSDREETTSDTEPSAPSSPQPLQPPSPLEVSLGNVCSVGLAKIFLRSLNQSARKTVLAFEALLRIAESPERPADARLTVLKLLFRLRCDSSGSVTVITVSEDDFLGNVLGRTVDSSPAAQVPLTGSPGTLGVEDPGLLRKSSLKDSSAGAAASRAAARAAASYLRAPKLTPPIWTYSSQVLPEDPPNASSPYVYAHTTANAFSDCDSGTTQTVSLKANMWLESVISLLQRETNWDVYSYVLAHLGPQLSNKDLFKSSIPQIKLLRSVLCDQVKNGTFREPPGSTGVKKTDVAACIFECLTMLVSYHEHFAKSEQDELVRSFMLGIIGSWGGTSRGCIHALSLCCFETPLSVTKSLNGILDKMSKVITMSNLAVHILEFLSLLARLPDVYVNLREEDIRTVFGICIRFLQTSREQRLKAESPTGRHAQAETPDSSLQDGMSTYIYTLTHHTMVFWFLSLKLMDRAKHVNWITSRLIFKDESEETVEEASQVFMDLMQRSTFSDLGDTIPYDEFPPSPEHGSVVKKSWVFGMSIITVETAGVSGLTQITKRQASGTTYAMYQQRTAPVLPHQVPPTHDAHIHSDDMRTAVFPSHVMLQLTTTAFPIPTNMQPIPLAEDDITRRALSTFDRNDIVDGHKIGVVYIGNGQKSEAEILSNTNGSADYEYFLSGLGTKVPLRGAQFNTQGLHPDIDGDSTYAWRDRVTEIVYHVATMMPTDFDGDPNCINKKRHIGNDYVNIIFNRSNDPFDFDTIASQFNFINIVISPVSRIGSVNPPVGPSPTATENPMAATSSQESTDPENMYYQVKVLSKPDVPEISCAAAPKVVSGKNLAAFVRILALNSSVFSLVWSSHGEHISSWRNRLREIKRLRERALGMQSQSSDTTSAESSSSTGTGIGAGASAAGTARRNMGSVAKGANIQSEELPTRSASVKTDFSSDWNAAAEANTLSRLDFSRWCR